MEKNNHYTSKTNKSSYLLCLPVNPLRHPRKIPEKCVFSVLPGSSLCVILLFDYYSFLLPSTSLFLSLFLSLFIFVLLHHHSYPCLILISPLYIHLQCLFFCSPLPFPFLSIIITFSLPISLSPSLTPYSSPSLLPSLSSLAPSHTPLSPSLTPWPPLSLLPSPPLSQLSHPLSLTT